MREKQTYSVVSVIGFVDSRTIVIEQSEVFGREKLHYFTQACLEHHSFTQTCLKICKEKHIENSIHFNDYIIEGKYDIHWRVYMGKIKNSQVYENTKKYLKIEINELDKHITNFKYNQHMICTDLVEFLSSQKLKLFNFKDNTMKEDLLVKRRESVVVILEDMNREHILCLKWNNERKWKSLIGGGIENNDIITSALNEVKEESGFKDIEFVKELETQCHDKFFAPHKKENRYIINRGVVLRLRSNIQDTISNSELEKHTPVWIKREKVIDYLSADLENHKILFKEYLGEKIEYDLVEDLLNS